MVSSFAAKAARKATANTMQDYEYRTANVVSSASENKENQLQLDKVVESVANATKRLSQASTTTTNSSKRKSQNHVGPWRLGRTLGRGSTGRVRLLKHSITGQLLAVKIVPKLNSENQSNNKKLKNNIKIDKNGLPYGIEREIIIMKVISHPNIMALYDVWENKNELYLVLEYIEGGELFDYLVRKGKLEEKEAVMYFRQIISGLQYCHKFNICHRDLKPENLLLDKNRKIKIADFGMATLETTTSLLETSCGSPHYASPEIVSGKNYHGGPSDIWSAGIILFALLTGRLPFDDPNIRELLLKVQTGKFKMPANLSTEAKDLIWKMLRVDPRQRITIDQILKHPLVLKYSSNKKSVQVNDFSKIDNLDMSPIYDYNEEILKNLQTLWRGVDVNKLKARLSSTDKNSEKIFYQLLKNHLKEHQNSTKSSSQIILPNTLPRSTSIVTTTITDENGDNIKTVTRRVPNSVAPLPPTSTTPSGTTTTTTATTFTTTNSRKLLGAINSNLMNLMPSKKTKTLDGKKQVISASSSYRKPKSFKAYKKSGDLMSRSSSKKSVVKSIKPALSSKNVRSLLQQQQPSAYHPRLPDVRESKLNVMDFMYLCDEIFGKDETVIGINNLRSQPTEIESEESLIRENSALTRQLDIEADLEKQALLKLKQEHELALEEARQARLLAEKQSRAKEELKQLETLKSKKRDLFLASYPKSSFQNPSLDPSRKISNEHNKNASEVLDKLGVRMSKFGNLRDLKFNPTSSPLPSSNLVMRPPPPGMMHSHMIESKSVSTRDLKSYLKDESKKNISIDEYNKHNNHETTTGNHASHLSHLGKSRTHTAKPSEDLSFDFSINEAQRMPISPVDKFTFGEPKLYSIDNNNNNNNDNDNSIRKSPTMNSMNVDERYLDADISMSSFEGDQDLMRLVNAIGEIDMDVDPMNASNNSNNHNKITGNEIGPDAGSFIVHHRVANSRDESNLSITNGAKLGQPVFSPRSSMTTTTNNNNNNIRTSLLNGSIKSITGDNNGGYMRDDETNESMVNFNLTPEKKKQPLYNNLKSLIMDDDLLSSKKQDKSNGANNYLRLSIYEDPDDTGIIEQNNGQQDEEEDYDDDQDDDSVENTSFDNDLIDMNHYDKNNREKYPVRSSMLNPDPRSLSPIVENFNESNTNNNNNNSNSGKSGNDNTDSNNNNNVNGIDDNINMKKNDFGSGRKKSAKFKEFFMNGYNNSESKESRKNFLQPIRQAPRLPSYKTYDFDETIEKDARRKQQQQQRYPKKTTSSTATANANSTTKQKLKKHKSGGHFLKKLMQFFD